MISSLLQIRRYVVGSSRNPSGFSSRLQDVSSSKEKIRILKAKCQQFRKIGDCPYFLIQKLTFCVKIRNQDKIQVSRIKLFSL